MTLSISQRLKGKRRSLVSLGYSRYALIQWTYNWLTQYDVQTKNTTTATIINYVVTIKNSFSACRTHGMTNNLIAQGIIQNKHDNTFSYVTNTKV